MNTLFRGIRRVALVLFLLLASSYQLQAVSIAPQIIEKLRADGRLAEVVAADLDARARGVWQPNPNAYRPRLTCDVDTLRCLIILVDFADMPHEAVLNSQPAHFDTLLFSVGIRQPGSMTDYYLQNSYGQVRLIGHVTQWYRMPQPYSYYVNGQRGFGQYPQNAQRLTEDAVVAADPAVNFNLYDNDDDGYVDALFVVHAGPGYEDTGNLNYIHSHAWTTSYRMPVDDVFIHHYSMEPEETAAGSLITIGVFCHEFGHILGLPDLYDYDYDSDGVGMWSIMAAGSWGGGGRSPVHFDAWSKVRLGFATPTVLTSNLAQEQIDAVEYTPDIYLLYSRGQTSYQYFLVENRRRRLFDSSLPGQGLLIYHIDETVPNNNNQNHYKVAVEQADGRFDLENNRGSDAGDPWPGSTNNRLFDDYSVPNSNLYFGIPSEVAVRDISNSDSSMFATLMIFSVDPLYELLRIVFIDSAGNGNGRPEAGETCWLLFRARNIRAAVNDLTVTVHFSDPRVVVIDSQSTFGPLPTITPFDNQSDPMVFTLPSDFDYGFVEVYLDFSARGGQYNQRLSARLIFGTPPLLLVDDDGGGVADTFLSRSLDQLGWSYLTWDVAAQGSPTSQLSAFQCVIWLTGDSRTIAPSPEYIAGLMNYLDQGGRLLLTSQDFVELTWQRGTAEDLYFLQHYLQVNYDTLAASHVVDGVGGTVFGGMRFVTGGPGGAQNQVSQDRLIAGPQGIPLLAYYPGGQSAAVGVSGQWSAITVGFGAEAIADEHILSRTRAEFLSAAFDFLGVSLTVEEPAATPGDITITNYPNPFNAVTTIEYQLPTPSHVSLTIYDVLGRLVDVILDEDQCAGHHRTTWSPTDRSSGIYFYHLRTTQRDRVGRMLFLK